MDLESYKQLLLDNLRVLRPLLVEGAVPRTAYTFMSTSLQSFKALAEPFLRSDVGKEWSQSPLPFGDGPSVALNDSFINLGLQLQTCTRLLQKQQAAQLHRAHHLQAVSSAFGVIWRYSTGFSRPALPAQQFQGPFYHEDRFLFVTLGRRRVHYLGVR